MSSFIPMASVSFPFVIGWESFQGVPTYSMASLLNYLSTYFIAHGCIQNAHVSKPKMGQRSIKISVGPLSACSHWALYPKEEAWRSITNFIKTASSDQLNFQAKTWPSYHSQNPLDHDCLHDSQRAYCVTNNWHVHW